MLEAFQDTLRQIGETDLAELFLRLTPKSNKKQSVYKEILSFIDRDYFRLTISNRVFNFKALIQLVHSLGNYVRHKYKVDYFHYDDFQLVYYLVYCVLYKDEGRIMRKVEETVPFEDRLFVYELLDQVVYQ